MPDHEDPVSASLSCASEYAIERLVYFNSGTQIRMTS